MTGAVYGKLLRTYISNGASPEVYQIIGGSRQDNFQRSNAKIDTTNKDTSDWAQQLANAGVRSASLTVSGVYTGSAGELALRAAASNRTTPNYKLVEPDTSTWIGPFFASNFSLTATHNDVMMYSCQLDSAGPIVYTPATV